MKNLFILLLFLNLGVFGQVQKQIKIETGYNYYIFNSVYVKPGPNWKGYYLREGDNGFDISFVPGKYFENNNLFLGVGFGVENLGGYNGFKIYGDMEFFNNHKKVSPILNLKMGYHKLYNQYEGGSDTILLEINVGPQFNFTEKSSIFIKTGFTVTMQSLMVPLRVGIRF